MKSLFPLILCLLLCGCAAAEPPETVEMSVTTAAAGEPEAVIAYAAESASEDPSLNAYPLTLRKVRGMQKTEQGLLVFSGYGSTTLTLLTGDELTQTAQCQLAFQLEHDDASIQFHQKSLSFFDPLRRETLVLDSVTLQEIAAIPLPPDAVGTPILSSDRSTLYYCTATCLRAWNQENGIHRTVKEMPCTEHTLAGLFLKDSVLKCRTEDGGTLFLSVDTGLLLSETEGDVSLAATDKGRFYAGIREGFHTLSLFGIAGSVPQILLPEQAQGTVFFLPEQYAAVCAMPSDEKTTLTCYDLETGCIRASLALNALQTPKALVCRDADSLYILAYDPAADCDLIYCWQMPEVQPGGTVFTEPYISTDAADSAVPEQCRTYASEIGSKYGVEILTGSDALTVQPWDYSFRPEVQPGILMQELAQMDQLLSVFPEGVLQQTAAHFSSLKLCLVRQISGAGSSGLSTATGIQFLDGTDAYVVIAAGRYSEQALYHELFHVMETHIFGGSTALDQWDLLNPKSFSYGMTSDSYLTGDGQAFADSYSMVSAREDRARIFENAMFSGNADMFRPAIMYKKLKQICLGIREAYGIQDTAVSYPWEQYLQDPSAA